MPDRIIDLITQYQQMMRGKKRIATISTQLQSEKQLLAMLEQKVDDEYADILRLESTSMRQLFTHILIDKKKQLEIERQEYLLAVLQYKEVKSLIEMMEQEKEDLSAAMRDEEILMRGIENELKRSEDEYLHIQSPYLTELKEVNAQLSKLVTLKMETHEALDVTGDLHSNFKIMVDLLNKAQKHDKWGTYYGEIQKAKRVKKENIDRAQEHMYIVRKLLVHLNGELQDVINIQQYFRRTEVLLRGFNVGYYKDLINDWVDESNLSETMLTTLATSKTIVDLIAALEKLIKSSQSEYLLLLDRRDRLIEMIVKEG